ncbi:MAG: hypothetical protein HC875_36730, partial [Anaerolineales bacterium]|nr:hypothetical protein [Anaerolineales bacterium]
MLAMSQLSFFKHLDTSFPTNKQTADSRKLRGGYYTPLELAHFLIKWGLRDDTMRILEPSCGDGNFILALLQRLHDPVFQKSLLPTIVAVELDPNELGKAKARAEQFGKNGAAL